MEAKTSSKAGKTAGLCPECGARLAFRERLLVGEMLSCDYCSSELEVAGLHPLSFQRLAKIEADEEDYGF